MIMIVGCNGEHDEHCNMIPNERVSCLARLHSIQEAAESQDGDKIASEYNLGEYSELDSDVDTIVDNGTSSGEASRFVKQVCSCLPRLPDSQRSAGVTNRLPECTLALLPPTAWPA